jgi:hypothetical protein
MPLSHTPDHTVVEGEVTLRHVGGGIAAAMQGSNTRHENLSLLAA